jgi:3-methyl-2-oxobutanoate hydroxymethyltransferase
MKITLADLHRCKREGRKIAAVVAYDYETIRIVDRAGADVISVGDSAGISVFGHELERETTIEEMLLLARAASRAVQRAFLLCDMPYGTYEVSPHQAARSAIRFWKEGRVDGIKVQVSPDQARLVEAMAATGVPVFCQFGATPTASAHLGGIEEARARMSEEWLVEAATTLERAGASLLDISRGGPATGAVARAVKIPVLGGGGNDGNCDGQIMQLKRFAGGTVEALDGDPSVYTNVARAIADAVLAYCSDVQSGRLPVGRR